MEREGLQVVLKGRERGSEVMVGYTECGDADTGRMGNGHRR